jgi:hypothetical protein
MFFTFISFKIAVSCIFRRKKSNFKVERYREKSCMAKKFVPYNELSMYQQVIVVDSFHPDGLVLSHWRGAPKIEEIHDDTSTAIVLNALAQGTPDLSTYPYVTNNHFDIDGFLGIWALCYPEKAMANSNLLRKMALIGDFRELSLSSEEDHLALKLACWINTVERERFYAPFASYEPGKNEVRLCVSKYLFFLQQFGKALQNPDDFKHDWQEEYEQVVQDMQAIEGPESKANLLGDIRLMVIDTPQPLHYYALFSQSTPADMVLCMYKDNRYELEYKYTTWVDCATRAAYPRLDLQPLANILNRNEEGSFLWRCDKLTDTGPILRLSGEKLSKEQRFDHPRNRPIHSSSIPPEKMLSLLREYFSNAYQKTVPKARWSWQEIRQVNQLLDK